MAHPVYRKFLHWTRTLHTYATMLALILLIFFSFTGFVMNHAAWFGIDDYAETNQTAKAPLPADIIKSGAAGKNAKDSDYAVKVEVYLRRNEGARGELTAFDDQDDSTRVQFIAVGRKMEYTIAKAPAGTEPVGTEPAPAAAAGDAKAGVIEEHYEIRNSLALMSDLHKGTGSGGPWRLFIDATAIFLAFASLTGVILWISLPKRRTLGIISLVVGIGLCAACYLFLLP